MSATPVIPEPIREQMDKTKYYVPPEDDPTTAAVKQAGGIAYQDQNDPDAVAILDPNAPNLTAVKGHEAYHAMVANMPPAEAAKIPPDDYSDRSKTYDISDAPKWRAAGNTITTIPQEKALASKEPGTAAKALLGKDRTGIEALAKYDRQLAARANVIRGYQAEADATRVPAASTKSAPELGPHRPATPAKKIGAEEIQEAKAKGLQKRADRIRRCGSWAGKWPIFEAMRSIWGGRILSIPGMAAESVGTLATVHAIASLMEKPAIVNFLTEATAQNVATIPEDLRSDMPQIVRSAQAQGIEVSPALTLAFRGAAALAPRRQEQNPTDAWQGLGQQ